MRLKAMEKIDEDKDKKHTGKLADNPEDRTLYITCQIATRVGHAAVLNNRYLRLSNRRFIGLLKLFA